MKSATPDKVNQKKKGPKWKREGLSLTTRFEVLSIAGFACRYCGDKSPDAQLQVDHLKPKSEGGSDDLTNLVAACRSCNLGKGQMLYDEEEVSKRIAADVEKFRGIRRSIENQGQEAVEIVLKEWAETFGPMAGNVRPKILYFVKRLPLTEIIECIHATARKEEAAVKFQYFIGCCWHRIREKSGVKYINRKP
jgi:hypothetical protein